MNEKPNRDLSCARIIQNNEIYTDSMSSCVAFIAKNLTNYFSDSAKRKKKLMFTVTQTTFHPAQCIAAFGHLAVMSLVTELHLLRYLSEKTKITFLSYFSCATAM